MQRVGPGRNPALDKFGTGKHGFTAGNPQTGTPATTPGVEWFDAVQEELARVVEGAGMTLDPARHDQLLVAIKQIVWGGLNRPTTLAGYGIDDGLRRYRAGQPLPTSDLGPIWHDDYASLMTWKAFNLNGASYTGYASVLVGNLLFDTQPTPRTGYIKSGVQNLNRTAYAALRGWAMHNGVLVAPDTWVAGAIAMADNNDGSTFRVFDVRGEFPRFWDDGRGVDSGRVLGSAQSGSRHVAYTYGSHGQGRAGAWWADYLRDDAVSGGLEELKTVDGTVIGGNGHAIADPAYAGNGAHTLIVSGTSRPRNVALLASIKF